MKGVYFNPQIIGLLFLWLLLGLVHLGATSGCGGGGGAVATTISDEQAQLAISALMLSGADASDNAGTVDINVSAVRKARLISPPKRSVSIETGETCEERTIPDVNGDAFSGSVSGSDSGSCDIKVDNSSDEAACQNMVITCDNFNDEDITGGVTVNGTVVVALCLDLGEATLSYFCDEVTVALSDGSSFPVDCNATATLGIGSFSFSGCYCFDKRCLDASGTFGFGLAETSATCPPSTWDLADFRNIFASDQSNNPNNCDFNNFSEAADQEIVDLLGKTFSGQVLEQLNTELGAQFEKENGIPFPLECIYGGMYCQGDVGCFTFEHFVLAARDECGLNLFEDADVNNQYTGTCEGSETDDCFQYETESECEAYYWKCPKEFSDVYHHCAWGSVGGGEEQCYVYGQCVEGDERFCTVP